jgi:type VI secretion system protein VasD
VYFHQNADPSNQMQTLSTRPTCRKALTVTAIGLVAITTMGGCAGPAGTLVTVANMALEASGLKKAELPDSQKPPRLVTLRLHAANNLNADANGKGMALVLRIYKLKSVNGFNQLTPAALSVPQQEKEVLGQDLVEVKEITLIPGQRYEMEEKVPYEAGVLGIAGWFRAPAPARWKYAFQMESSTKGGITMGIHACSLSVTAGTPISTEGDARLVSTARCS